MKGYFGRNDGSDVVLACATGCRSVIHTVMGVQREKGVTLQEKGALYLFSGTLLSSDGTENPISPLTTFLPR